MIHTILILSSNRNETNPLQSISSGRHPSGQPPLASATSIVLPHPGKRARPSFSHCRRRSGLQKCREEDPLLHAIGPLSVARVRSPLYTCASAPSQEVSFPSDGCTPVVIDPPLSSFVNQARRRRRRSFYTRSGTRKRDTASAATWRRSLDGRGTQWRAVAFLLVTCDLLCWRLRNAFACLFNLFKWSCKRGYNVVGLWTISEIEDWEMGNLIFVSFVPFSWVNFGVWIERCKNCYTSFG